MYLYIHAVPGSARIETERWQRANLHASVQCGLDLKPTLVPLNSFLCPFSVTHHPCAAGIRTSTQFRPDPQMTKSGLRHRIHVQHRQDTCCRHIWSKLNSCFEMSWSRGRGVVFVQTQTSESNGTLGCLVYICKVSAHPAVGNFFFLFPFPFVNHPH